MTNELTINDKVYKIKGVGPKKSKSLNELDIFTVLDLLNYYPKKYSDKRYIKKINSLETGDVSLIECKILNVKLDSKGYNKKSGRVKIMAEDSTGKISIVFFNGGYLYNNFKKGNLFTFYGEVSKAYGKTLAFKHQLINPSYTISGSEDDIRSIVPIYQTGKHLFQNDLKKWIRYGLTLEDQLIEWIPSNLIKQNNMCDIKYALNNIHYPKDETSMKAAKYRLIYGEFLKYKLAAIYKELENKQSSSSKIEDIDTSLFIKSLEFDLTIGQVKAINELEADLISEKPMNRLLQGDVGCGKTVVAETLIYKVVKSGYQVAYMAPTEILATQLYNNLTKAFKEFDINIKLLTSSVKGKQKTEILDNIEEGKIQLLIGTHSLIQDNVNFNNLMLVITDEQHRFGVNQRKTLKEKGSSPNVLVMTATPIPRTLAATVYGNLDFTVIKTMPKGRKSIITTVSDELSKEKAYISLKKELELGHQGYVVAPLIEESEDSDLNSVSELYNDLKIKLKDFKLGLLHGKLSKEDKDMLMNEFLEKRIDLLVATVVIEVGIDVPNATIMLIENAERFGLAQLHQLRGRVGRSDLQSFCHLVSYSNSDIATRRMNAMKMHASGFDISEEDFKLRGPGDLNSTIQHGSNFNLDNFIRYIDILEKAGRDAENIFIKDAKLANIENKFIKDEIDDMQENGFRNVL
ncbi:MAG: ATP-dependent DNA helicase RecG [Peptostreptococcaceae bacterium]|nr:ATP-dependent DNA helicase RecG [Peptostreptococcaceae bacterium]